MAFNIQLHFPLSQGILGDNHLSGTQEIEADPSFSSNDNTGSVTMETCSVTMEM